jgi:hypothetical protein
MVIILGNSNWNFAKFDAFSNVSSFQILHNLLVIETQIINSELRVCEQS